VEHLEQVQRAVDYIEDHLNGDLTTEAIAKVAGFSKWHFQNVFSAAVGDSLKDYIRKRRLTAAAVALGMTDGRVIEIAFEAGFESQESFTRAFKSMFGKTPGECRKEDIKSIMSLNKPRITMEYLDHLYGGINMQPVLKFVAEKKVMGVGTRFISARSPDHNNETKIPALWGRYLSRSGEIAQRLSPADLGVVICLDDKESKSHPDELFYLAGAEVAGDGNAPDGLTVLTIPAGEYAVFTHKGLLDKIGMTMNYIYGSWLPKSGQKLREAPEFEVYDQRFIPNSEQSELDIYIPIAGKSL
jgi:AraC family transcriptional regulator